jgi:hypothetical protein
LVEVEVDKCRNHGVVVEVASFSHHKVAVSTAGDDVSYVEEALVPSGEVDRAGSRIYMDVDDGSMVVVCQPGRLEEDGVNNNLDGVEVVDSKVSSAFDCSSHATHETYALT